MTVEEHLRMIIGDLVLKLAQLQAEIDALKLDLAARDAVVKEPDGQ